MTQSSARQTARRLAMAALAAWALIAASGCGRQPSSRPSGEEGRGSRPDFVFHGTSDASAGAALDGRTFVVADDENNVLRVYFIEGGDLSLRFDLTAFLGVATKSPEADIEAAARVGDRIYWITSHGRNRNGKWRPNRCRFFATEITTGAEGHALRPVGRPYVELADRLATDRVVREVCPSLAGSYRHGKADKEDARSLAPKDGGLNIEGLSADADGNCLYIGLRNPLAGPTGSAIVVPLLNPADVCETALPPRFGRPMLWNLDGLGIRDMVFSAHHRAAFILAGTTGEGRRCALYRWSQHREDQPVRLRDLGFQMPGWCPEAILSFRSSSRLLVLSDDGTMPVRVAGPSECLDAEYYRRDGAALNKHLRDESRRSCRAMWITP